MTETANTSQQQATNTAQQTSDQAATAQDGQKPDEALTFDAWYGKLDDKQKDLLDDHVTGLKSALATKTEELSKLNSSFKALRKSIDSNNPEEAKRQMDAIAAERDDWERRAQFAENAPDEGVSNPKAAWLIAKGAGLINERTGKVDFMKLREVAPEFFKAKTTTPTAHAGAGATQTGAVKPDMSKWIRAAAGRA